MKTPEQVKQKLAQWYGHSSATGSQYSQGFKVGMISALEWMLSDDSETQGVDEGYGPREATRWMPITLTENVHDPSFFNTPRSHDSHADEIYCPRKQMWVSVDEDCLDCDDEELEGCGLSDEEDAE